MTLVVTLGYLESNALSHNRFPGAPRLVVLALPLIINRHGSQAIRPADKVPELPKRLASNNSLKDLQPARDYLKDRGLYVRLQNLIETTQYQIDQQAEIYEATNPAQNLTARFNGRDVVLQPLTDNRTTTLQARLSLQPMR